VTYHITGSISVDPTGISTTPVDLTAGMVQSWQISVLDSTNTLLFSLSSPTNALEFSTTGDDPGLSTDNVAPQITTTAIFLPLLPSSTEIFTQSSFFLETSAGGLWPLVAWESDLDNRDASYSADTRIRIANGDDGVGGVSTVNSKYNIATAEPSSTVIPEPASLVIWSLVAGVFGVWRRSSARFSRIFRGLRLEA
jgi:hypothetical protein